MRKCDQHIDVWTLDGVIRMMSLLNNGNILVLRPSSVKFLLNGC